MIRLFLIFLLVLPITGQNLLPNSSFELGTRGWSHFGSGNWSNEESVYHQTTTKWHGGTACKFEMSVNTHKAALSEVLRLKTNCIYTLSAHLYESDAGTYGPVIAVRNPRTGTYPWSTIPNPGTATWERFALTFTNGATTTDYQVVVYAEASGYPGRYLYVDAVQLEEDSTTNAYAPRTPDLQPAFSATVYGNTFLESETPSVPLYYWANAATNNTVDWELRDWLTGSRQTTGSLTLSNTGAAVVLTNINASLSPAKRGHFRLLSWIRNVPGTKREIALSVLPQYRTLTASTNGQFGSHIKGYPLWLSQARRAGWTWSRTLSISPLIQYWNDIEAVDNTFTFTANHEVTNMLFYGINPLIGLGGGRPNGSTSVHIPSFGTNAGGEIVIAAYTNFAAVSASNYHALGARYFEIWNEPFTEANLSADNYRDILTNTYPYIHALSGAQVAAPVDYYTNYAWSVFSVGGASNFFDVYATHIYDYTSTSGGDQMAATLGKTAWNTEAGSTFLTSYRTLLWENTVGSFDPFAGAELFDQTRTPRMSALFQLMNWAATSGSKIRKNFYYEGRTDGALDNLINYSIFDWDQSLRPIGAVVAATAWLADESIKGASYNLGSGIYCEIFKTDTTNSVAVVWTSHMTNVYNLTTTLSAADFRVFDCVGNSNTYSSGVKFSAISPIFIKGINQATNTLGASLTATLSADTTSPTPEIVTAPIGTAVTTNYTFRWWGVDDVGLDRFVSSSNSLTFRWKCSTIDSDYGAWTVTNSQFYPTIPASGTFAVQAKDPAGNIGTETYDWPWAQGTNSITATTLNVQNLIITGP
jgi:hypothetical protein